MNCTVCKTEMQIDDAFAGGACRCQRCGTIQTVPKRLKQSPASAQPAASKSQTSSKSKPLYEKKVKSDMGLSSGLDELAEVVASSGLSSMRTQKKSPAASSKASIPKPPPVKKSKLPIVLAIVCLIVLVIGILIGLLLHK